MSHRLLTELERRLDNWRETMNDDAARLRSYQRHLLEMRQFSPRPHNSVCLTLRQCAAARKMKRHAASTLATCKRNIRELSGTAAQ